MNAEHAVTDEGIRARVRSTAEARAISMRKLAALAGVEYRALISYVKESQPSRLPAIVVAKIALALRVDFRWLLTGDLTPSTMAKFPWLHDSPVVRGILAEDIDLGQAVLMRAYSLVRTSTISVKGAAPDTMMSEVWGIFAAWSAKADQAAEQLRQARVTMPAEAVADLLIKLINQQGRIGADS